jgi:hypothetical protein
LVYIHIGVVYSNKKDQTSNIHLEESQRNNDEWTKQEHVLHDSISIWVKNKKKQSYENRN